MVLNARSMMSLGIAGILAAGLLLGIRSAAEGQAKLEADPAVERARQEIKMLDDIYKTSVVAITNQYVHKESDVPAIIVAKGLFEAMKKQGWHEVRLIDVTGNPYNDKNVANDEFERAAVKALAGGKDYYEQLVKLDGKQPRLRAATAVPVVMKKCTMCHENYKDVKSGVAIGALTYDVPVK